MNLSACSTASLSSTYAYGMTSAPPLTPLLHPLPHPPLPMSSLTVPTTTHASPIHGRAVHLSSPSTPSSATISHAFPTPLTSLPKPLTSTDPGRPKEAAIPDESKKRIRQAQQTIFARNARRKKKALKQSIAEQLAMGEAFISKIEELLIAYIRQSDPHVLLKGIEAAHKAASDLNSDETPPVTTTVEPTICDELEAMVERYEKTRRIELLSYSSSTSQIKQNLIRTIANWFADEIERLDRALKQSEAETNLTKLRLEHELDQLVQELKIHQDKVMPPSD